MLLRLLSILLITTLSSSLTAQICGCSVTEVQNNTVKSLDTLVGTVITVGTVSEFQSAISQANQTGGNMTILIEDGTYAVASTASYPYITASNLVIRSVSGNRDAVILTGQGMQDVAPLTEIVLSLQGDNVIVSDLTIASAGNHGISISSDNHMIHNVRFQDIFEQMMKGNSPASANDNTLVQCCLFEYTAGVGPQFYIGGLDIHGGTNWIVRDNIFYDIASPSQSLAEHAIHFWDSSADNLIERNVIVGCDRGIGFGLGSSPNNGGIIRNNMIYNDGSQIFHDVGIGLETSPNTEVYNNTVMVQYQNAIEYRFTATSGVSISNNLTNRPITSRNGGSGTVSSNFTTAINAWFINPTGGDLRLASAQSQVTDQGTDLSGLVDDDIDQTLRPQGIAYDLGAHELQHVVDADNDGFFSDVDCDDMNEFVNPGQTEIVYNGWDDDCNPLTLDDDLDNDGYVLAVDCNDTDPNINPGMQEIPNNGIDDDCDPNTSDSFDFPNCPCSVSEVEANSVKSLDLIVGTVVSVSTATEFTSAINQANSSGGNMTILMEDGVYQVASPTSYPFITGSNIVIRSASGNRDAVVITGSGMVDVSPNTEMGLQLVGDYITVADLTIRGVGNHGISVNSDYYFIHNVRIQDTYEQMFKGNNPNVVNESSIIQCSLFEYTAGVGPQWFIGGIDVHAGQNWIVRDNVFRDIASPSFQVAEHAVHFRNDSQDNVIERNLITGCDRGIGFGLGTDNNIGGIIRNNMIFNDGSQLYDDVGIGLESSPNTQVYNNTVHVQYQNAIEYRFVETTNVMIRNNLTNRPITARNGGTAIVENNNITAVDSWFVDLQGGDLRLATAIGNIVDAGLDLSGLVDVDIDQSNRPQGVSYDIGAHEFTGILQDADNDGFFSDVDCDDMNENVNPGQEESAYNGIDDDCNPLTPDDDLDGDGFLLADDCDDMNENVNPNAQEIPYNGIDDDCNANSPDDDLDGDGVLLADDCDDMNPDVNPEQSEIPYNGVDDDCNEITPDDDLDGDGFLLADDCDDMNENVNPDAQEIPYNGIDDDCNANSPDDDLDGDGILLADDCDDMNPDVNPEQSEIPYNGVDDDCNEITPDDDLDGDGFLLADDCDDMNENVNPDAEEIANNGIDEDCDGSDLLVASHEADIHTISFWPNPSNGTVYVKNDEGYDYEIIDTYGRTLAFTLQDKTITINNYTGIVFLRVTKNMSLVKVEKILIVE